MRTTIELEGSKRARLLALAAERGEKGFSRLIDEALEIYFRSLEERREDIQAALALKGTLSDREAKAMRADIARLRSKWRSA